MARQLEAEFKEHGGLLKEIKTAVEEQGRGFARGPDRY